MKPEQKESIKLSNKIADCVINAGATDGELILSALAMTMLPVITQYPDMDKWEDVANQLNEEIIRELRKCRKAVEIEMRKHMN